MADLLGQIYIRFRQPMAYLLVCSPEQAALEESFIKRRGDRSAVAAEAHRVRPGRRQSLLPRVDDEAQRFQCRYAQNGLVNVPHEERGRGFTAIDPDNRDIGTEPHSPPIGEAHAHGSPRAPDPERAR